jgi:hypothetical protein
MLDTEQDCRIQMRGLLTLQLKNGMDDASDSIAEIGALAVRHNGRKLAFLDCLLLRALKLLVTNIND